MTKVKIPLLRFAYLNYRKCKTVNKVCVMSGGKMSEHEFEKYSMIAKSLTGKK